MKLVIPTTSPHPGIISRGLNTHIRDSDSFINSINNIQNNNKSIWNKLVSLINRIRFYSDRKSNIKFIEKYFQLPESYSKGSFHYKDTTAMILVTEHEKYIPSNNDIKTAESLKCTPEAKGFTCDYDLSYQFNLDFHRMRSFLHTPYRQENSQEIKHAKFLTAKFGAENAKIISQFAHQGLLNEVVIDFNLKNKKENINISNNRSTYLIFTETQKGDCIITAKTEMDAMNIDIPEKLKGVTVSITRETYLIKGEDGLFLKNHDKKDHLKFVITKKHNDINMS